MSRLPRQLLVLLLGTVLVVSGCVSPATRGVVAPKEPDATPEFHGAWQARPYSLPALSLTDRTGQRFNLRTSPSRPVTLIYFGYPGCPSRCDDTLRRLSGSLAELPLDIRDDVAVLVIDIADARTKPRRKRFHAWLDRIDAGFIGLTGPLDQVHGLARDLGVAVHRDADGVLMHGDQIIAFDRAGAGVLVWTSDVPPGQVRADLTVLVGAQR